MKLAKKYKTFEGACKRAELENRLLAREDRKHGNRFQARMFVNGEPVSVTPFVGKEMYDAARKAGIVHWQVERDKPTQAQE